MPNNFIKDIIKNANEQIKYKNTVTTGEITVNNGDGTYDVKIANASSAYPNVETINYDAVFSVGEIVDIIFEQGCKEAPKIIGHSKKIKQEPKKVEVDYSGGTRAITLYAYTITGVSAYLKGEIKLNGMSNCTRRGFRYGLTTAYGSDTHDDGNYGEGTFNKQIIGLEGETTYHFQTYVLDSNGNEQVGEDKSFITTEGIFIGVNNQGTGSLSQLYTRINLSEPSNGSGKITSITIGGGTNPLLNVKVATFYRPNPIGFPNNFSTRSYTTIGTVTGVQAYEVNLDVEIGDFIGMYWEGGAMKTNTSGYAGVRGCGYDQIPCSNLAFTSFWDNYALYLYGTG